MVQLNDVLKPVSGKHSIKEAVITLFLTNPLVKPDRFEALIKNQFKDRFQKFEKVNQVQLQFKGKDGGEVESTPPQVRENVGFRFVRFNEGKTETVLQGLNEMIRNYISYHSLDYDRWEKFFADFQSATSVLAEFHPNLFVNAFSLHYLDEFSWEKEGEVQTNIVFNERSRFLPQEFFKTQLNNYQLTTVKQNKHEYFDRLEIKIEKRPKTFLTASHNVIQNFRDQMLLNDLIKSPELKDMLDLAHIHNKQVLSDVFTTEVCKLIDLKI